MDWIRDKRNQIGVVLVACAVLIGMTMFARAADKGGPKAAPAATADDAGRSWTGFGGDVHGSLVTGAVDFGAPINFSMNGQSAGVGVWYNHQFGVIVLGADAGYDRLWGDLHTYGVDYAVTLGLRAGVLPTKSTLIYARGEWIRASGGGDHLDGWGLGGGIETKIANSPMSVGIEWMHDWFDSKDFGPGVDVTADRITARLKFDLYNKPVQSIFADR